MLRSPMLFVAFLNSYNTVFVYTPPVSSARKCRSEKLTRLWHGPFTVNEQTGSDRYTLTDSAGKFFSNVHAARIKIYYQCGHSLSLPHRTLWFQGTYEGALPSLQNGRSSLELMNPGILLLDRYFDYSWEVTHNSLCFATLE